MRISIIAAVAANGIIGRDNDLACRLSGDLRRFRRLTQGHHLVVGRRTWESIGRPLPERTMVVISRSHLDLPEGVLSAGSLDEAIELARAAEDDEVFIGGGAAIYSLALPLADRLYLTEVHTELEGDVRFPAYDRTGWRQIAVEPGVVDDHSPLEHTFVTYERADDDARRGNRSPIAPEPRLAG